MLVITLLTTWPLAHRARDYFIVNNHTFGGKRFQTQFSAGDIYGVYLTAIGILIGSYGAILAIVLVSFVVIGFAGGHAGALAHFNPADLKHSPLGVGIGIVGIVLFIAFYLLVLSSGRRCKPMST